MNILDRILKWIPAVAIIVLILCTWELIVRVRDIASWLLPAPTAIAYALYESRGILASHTLVTLEEVLIGFAIALLAGVVLASGLVLSKTLEKTLYPFLIASQTVPIIVIAPMLLVWVGYGLTPKIIVVALISFFPIVVNTIDGMKSVDRDVENLLRTMGANRWQIFTKVQIPVSLPYLFSGLRVAVAASVIGAVLGEWVGSSEGLGYLMIRSKPQFQTELVFAAIVILSVMGILLFSSIGFLEKLIIPWWHKERENSLVI